MKVRKAVVFCSSSDRIDPKYNEAAREVVRALHAYGWGLVSGGSDRDLVVFAPTPAAMAEYFR